MTPVHIPETLFPVSLLAPAADAAGRSSAAISLKNAKRAFIVAHLTQGNAATVALTPEQCTLVDGTGAKALTNNIPLWSNLDVAAADTLVRRTDAKNYTTDAGVKNKIVVFQIDPATALDIPGGFDCIRLTTGASNAANITSATLYIEPKHGSATANQQTFVTD